MKFDVNYELMAKIGEAKTGINLRRIGKKMAILNGAMSLVSILADPTDIEQIASRILYSFSITSFQSFGMEFAFSNSQKKTANEKLKILSSRLADLDVSTDSDLLLESKRYKIKYDIDFSEGIIPKITQNKYVMVPTHNDGEVSLLQEHIVGTRNFTLSVGEPEKAKQFKLVYGSL